MSQLAEPPAEVKSLLAHLERCGASTVETSSSGPHLVRVLAVDGVRISVRREYDSWSVEVAGPDGVSFPPSFWVHAVESRAELPDPVGGLSWVAELDAVLDAVIDNAATLRPALDVMRMEYEQQLSERLRRMRKD